MMTTAIICTLALGVLLFGLGLGVSMVRARRHRLWGSVSDPTDFLFRMTRAQGNTAEYAPFLAVLFLYLASHDCAAWVVWTMVVATVSRYVFVGGLLFYQTMAKPNLLRFVGALGTYATGVALCFALLGTL